MTKFRILNYEYNVPVNDWYNSFEEHELQLQYRNQIDQSEYENFDLDEVRCVYILRHAVRIIEGLSGNKVDSQSAALLIVDLRNYFYKVQQGEGNRNTVLHFIRKLLSLGLYKQVAECLREHLSAIEDPEVRKQQIQVLSFNQLYVDAGDVALFKENDIDTSLLYYSFAGTQWGWNPKQVGAQLNRLDSGQLSVEKIKDWRKFTERANRIMAGESEFEELDLSFQEESLFALYHKCIIKLRNYDITSSNELDALINYIEQNVKRVSNFARYVKIQIESIKRNFLPNILYLILSEQDRMSYYDQVITAVSENRGNKYIEIQNYLNQTRLDTKRQAERIFDFTIVMYTVDRMLQLLRVMPARIDAAYYTKYQTFSYMLPDACTNERRNLCGKLSVMHVSYMNDPNEGNILIRAIFGDTDLSDEMFSRKSVDIPYIFLKCFTAQIDYLPMWELYGDGAKGICLILDWEEWKESSLYYVCYLKKTRRGLMAIKNDNNKNVDIISINGLLKNIQQIQTRMEHEGKVVIEKLLNPIRYLFKDSSYSYEQEMRIMYHFEKISDKFKHTKDIPPKVFVSTNDSIQIKEIILGPKFKRVAEITPYLQEQIDIMAERTDTVSPPITLSAIDFR